ncbi:MAG: cytochrome c biogenesis protein ResB, partial [Thermogutta sp.]|nr:cytochrome c biogenesis protein ResB [Thermogutta sp.]
NAMRFAVRTLLPYDIDRPERKAVVPRPFRKRRTGMEQPRAFVRLTAGSQTKDSWLAVLPQGATEAFTAEELVRVAEGDRSASLILRYDAVDVGFRLRLAEFQRKMDPGTTQPSHYASLVDLYVPTETAERFGRPPADNPDAEELHDAGLTLVQPGILITLNHPVNLSDPRSGRTYRLYQEAFNGPFRPGDPVFERVLGPGSAKSELYASILTVNYDPGRGLKYFGSLLIVGGILIMYRMRAYFFRRRSREGMTADSLSEPGVQKKRPLGDEIRVATETAAAGQEESVVAPRR